MLRSLLSTCNRFERIALVALALTFTVSIYQIGQGYWQAFSAPAPAAGGSFVEGVVGELRFANPVLAQTDVDRDITKLVFCGLTKFDPVGGTVLPDAATHTLSADKKTYTFTLKNNVTWQDGVPVTADDVVFTFHDVLQHKDFPNATLAADFAGVSVQKIDEKTVTFTLQKPYAFFIFNTNLGLLPKHILKDTPVAELAASAFNLNPVGCGPYRLEAVTGAQLRLLAYDGYYDGRPLLDTVVFRIFPEEDQLFKNLDGLTGTADLKPEHAQTLANDSRLKLHNFTLPQYVALFLNNDRPVLSDAKTRLALQLATDKTKLLVAAAVPGQIIDTPLLEIQDNDWKYNYDEKRANGALFDAGWRYADPAALAPVPAATPASATAAVASGARFIAQPSADRYFATAASDFFVGGSVPAGTTAVSVNGYQLSKFNATKASWTYRAALGIGTLKAGENEYIVRATVAGKTSEIDRITIFQGGDEATRTSWLNSKTTPAVAPTAPAEVAKPAAFLPRLVPVATAQTAPAVTTVAQPAATATPIASVIATPVAATPSPVSPAVSVTSAVAPAANVPVLTKTDAPLKARRNAAGQLLKIEILVPAYLPEFVRIAETVKEQWQARGITVQLAALERPEFTERLEKGNYDVVVFGQNLGYNLDTYAFWHSSEARAGGSNLSNLKNAGVNAWLEKIRGSFDSADRRQNLDKLKELLATEVPAIMLYAPQYTYAVDQKILNFNLGRVALVRDRLAGLTGWYLRETRQLKPEAGFISFFVWLWQAL